MILALCIVFTSCVHVLPDSEANSVAIFLSTESDDITVGSLVTIDVLVTNMSSENVYITRLKSWPLKAFGGWAGWSLTIDGQDGQWSFVHAPSLPPPITEHDIVELKPYESYTKKIDVSSAIMRAEHPRQHLQDTPGVYTFSIDYLLKEHHLALGRALRTASSNALTAGLEQSLYRGPITSNELTINIKDNDTEPNK